MRTLLSTLMLAAASLLSNTTVQSHGSTEPQHGGIVRMVGETMIELVSVDGGADLYLREEDQPVPTGGMTGKVTVTIDGVKSEAGLSPAGDNKLQALGVKLSAPCKVSVHVCIAFRSALPQPLRARRGWPAASGPFATCPSHSRGPGGMNACSLNYPPSPSGSLMLQQRDTP